MFWDFSLDSLTRFPAYKELFFVARKYWQKFFRERIIKTIFPCAVHLVREKRARSLSRLADIAIQNVVQSIPNQQVRSKELLAFTSYRI